MDGLELRVRHGRLDHGIEVVTPDERHEVVEKGGHPLLRRRHERSPLRPEGAAPYPHLLVPQLAAKGLARHAHEARMHAEHVLHTRLPLKLDGLAHGADVARNLARVSGRRCVELRQGGVSHACSQVLDARARGGLAPEQQGWQVVAAHRKQRVKADELRFHLHRMAKQVGRNLGRKLRNHGWHRGVVGLTHFPTRTFGHERAVIIVHMPSKLLVPNARPSALLVHPRPHSLPLETPYRKLMILYFR